MAGPIFLGAGRGVILAFPVTGLPDGPLAGPVESVTGRSLMGRCRPRWLAPGRRARGDSMPKSMLVNVTAEEENRVAIVDDGVLDVFEIETLSKEHLKGNIFKVIVEGLTPALDAAGISRKIESAEHRERLRKILDELTVPSGYGVIVRTAGMETSTKELQADLESLLELWRTIEGAALQVKAPALVFQERDLVIRTIRDYFTTDIEEVLIDDEAAFQRAKKFFEAHMPDKAHVVRLYTGDRPIFTKHNLEDQIERIYKRTVQLKSGGSISIDQTEALTAIDVNSARSTRSASSEDTAARTNLEAAEEIARQLRLRDIGGLIVIDFIDMESSKHIRQVERAFADAMSRDKARYDVTRISKLGLLEVSRQRLKSTKASSSFMECPTCQGDGTIRTPEAAARAAFRKIQARVVRGDISGVKVFLPPEVALYLLNQKRDDLTGLEQRYKVAIEAVPEARLKASQFEIEEVRREETEIGPVVTADTVDEALAAGSLQPLARPPAEPQEAAPPKEAPQEAAEAGSKGRTRRRRRRGRGILPMSEPAARADGSSEPLSTPATPRRAPRPPG